MLLELAGLLRLGGEQFGRWFFQRLVKPCESDDDDAAVAQLVERVLGKDEVMSSSLISSSC